MGWGQRVEEGKKIIGKEMVKRERNKIRGCKGRRKEEDRG